MEIKFRSSRGLQYILRPLTKEYVLEYADNLIKAHNQIPHVEWNIEDFLANKDSKGSRDYLHKWALSFGVNYENQCVGFIVSFFREGSSEHFPYSSVYLHRIALLPKHQRSKVGTVTGFISLIHYFYFQLKKMDSMNDVYTTVQTNDEPTNNWVIDFYRKLSFTTFSKVHYPNKTDLLMSATPESLFSSKGYSITMKNIISSDDEFNKEINYLRDLYDEKRPI